MRIDKAADQSGVAATITTAAQSDEFDVNSVDLETAMMMVQSDRANNLEVALKDQIVGVGSRNKEIAALNKLIIDLRALRPTGANAGPDTFGNLGSTQAEGRELYGRAVAAGLKIPDPNGPDRVDEPGTNIYDAKQKTIDVWLEDLKGKIDALSSTQQMDMLRLQSLNNKRNEAFEILTNFEKKMSDSRSGIVANIR